MEQTTDARSEINRLNKIIDILADQIGILKAENTLYKKYIAGITAGNAIAFSDNGNPEAGTSIVEKVNASPTVETSIVEKVNALSGIGNLVAGKVNSESISGMPITGKAPDYIDTSYTNKKKLERAIKHFFPLRTKGSKISSFASQMLLLYNKHQASYPEMRKVSGMSQGGFNKQAPDLRKKGFVVRTSHQKYALTQMSKRIIDKVFGG
jgi:biotin operon repressor